MNGAFVISLDFELNWGTFDVATLEEYGENILGVRQVVPRLLELFTTYGMHVTWSTVGFLFFESKAELLLHLPTRLPNYVKPKYSSYEWLKQIGENEQTDPYHFGKSLVDQIMKTPHQTIGTHTFSHLSCLEQGVTVEAFKADIEAAKRVGALRNLPIRSIVYPRNQSDGAFHEAAGMLGIEVYRGNEQHRIYHPDARGDEGLLRRAIRLLDAYVNLTGHHTSTWNSIQQTHPYNVPSSRFLRPYAPSLRIVEILKLRRIKQSMTQAAKRGELYHLWWHPHNFGKNIEQNVNILEAILKHYKVLEKEYGWMSLSMEEVADYCNQQVHVSQQGHG